MNRVYVLSKRETQASRARWVPWMPVAAIRHGQSLRVFSDTPAVVIWHIDGQQNTSHTPTGVACPRLARGRSGDRAAAGRLGHHPCFRRLAEAGLDRYGRVIAGRLTRGSTRKARRLSMLARTNETASWTHKQTNRELLGTVLVSSRDFQSGLNRYCFPTHLVDTNACRLRWRRACDRPPYAENLFERVSVHCTIPTGFAAYLLPAKGTASSVD